MSYNRAQLREKIFVNLGESPVQDPLAAAMTDTTTKSFTATDLTKYADGIKVEIDSEVMKITGDPGTATQNVLKRGADGTVAATHANGAIVSLNPTWFAWQLESAINDCLANRVLKETENATAVTIVANKYKYDLPAAIKADRILGVWLRSSDGTYKELELRKFELLKGSGTAGVDEIEFAQELPSGRNIHIQYLAGFTAFSDDTTACSLPDNETAQMIPVWWACHFLLSQKETPRLRRDKGNFKKSSPPQGARELVSRDWLSDFISACRSTGLHPNILQAGPIVTSVSQVGR